MNKSIDKEILGVSVREFSQQVGRQASILARRPQLCFRVSSWIREGNGKGKGEGKGEGKVDGKGEGKGREKRRKKRGKMRSKERRLRRRGAGPCTCRGS